MLGSYVIINGQKLPLESNFKSFSNFINNSYFYSKRLQEYCKQNLTKESIEKLNYNQLCMLELGLKYIDSVYYDYASNFDILIQQRDHYSTLTGTIKLNISDEINIILNINNVAPNLLQDVNCLKNIMNLRYNDYFGYKDYIKRSIQCSFNEIIYELRYDE